MPCCGEGQVAVQSCGGRCAAATATQHNTARQAVVTPAQGGKMFSLDRQNIAISWGGQWGPNRDKLLSNRIRLTFKASLTLVWQF